ARPAEVIGEAVNKQLDAAVLPEFDDVLSSMNPLAVMKLPEVLQLVRREPDGVRRISHPQRLTFDKRKNRFRRLHAQLAIVFCHFVIVMNPGPTRLNDPIQPVRDCTPDRKSTRLNASHERRSYAAF